MDPLQSVEKARDRVFAAEDELRAAREELGQVVVAALKAGLTLRDVAAVLDVTRQRVHQIAHGRVRVT